MKLIDMLCVSPKLQPPSTTMFKVASGDTIAAYGKILLSLEIAGSVYTHVFHVLPHLNNQLILGSDFLNKYDAQISFPNKTVHLNKAVGLTISEPNR